MLTYDDLLRKYNQALEEIEALRRESTELREKLGTATIILV